MDSDRLNPHCLEHCKAEMSLTPTAARVLHSELDECASIGLLATEEGREQRLLRGGQRQDACLASIGAAIVLDTWT